MVKIVIDNREIEAEPGSMIIEAADRHQIKIPRFCYHKKLSIAANCRMCLVEVDKMGKPMPACATPVTEGMVVHTQSQKALDSQKAVMEFLLINHPLDCPICDQGGECELQDISMGYGQDLSRFTEGKRSVDSDNLGPLVATEMTRCIHCTRCVRFGDEVAGVRELGATSHGEEMKIGTYVKHSLSSEVAGNVIDLCPVGALTSKPFLYKARTWELTQHETISPHDCVGTNLYIHTRRGEVMRVVPKENTTNETWCSDRDRFGYLGLNNGDRLLNPMIKDHGEWREVEWETALTHVANKLSHIINEQGANQVGILASPNATTEEFYLLEKLARGLTVNNIDHRLKMLDVSDQDLFCSYPGLSFKLHDLPSQNHILLIGSNIQIEQPVASLRVRKATRRGGEVMAINPVDYPFNFNLSAKIIAQPQHMVTRLTEICKALALTSQHPIAGEIKQLFADVVVSAEAQVIADKLLQGNKNTIILGALATQHELGSAMRCLSKYMADLAGAKWGCFTDGANSAGGYLAGAVPHRSFAGESKSQQGLSAQDMLQQALKAYVLLGVEPEFDFAQPRLAQSALKDAEFVVALSAYKGEGLSAVADVLLPIAPYAETAGSYVNVEGAWQSFSAATTPMGSARPAWKILRVLGNLFHLEGFEYVNVEQVRNDLLHKMTQTDVVTPEHWQLPVFLPPMSKNTHGLNRLSHWPIYRTDATVRRAQALQQAASNGGAIVAALNSNSAQKYQVVHGQQIIVQQGRGSAQLTVAIDDRVADDCIVVPAGVNETAQLGPSFGPIAIERS